MDIMVGAIKRDITDLKSKVNKVNNGHIVQRYHFAVPKHRDCSLI